MKTKLRRVAILALVLVLLISNTVGANASTGNTSITVSTYADLCNALENAENGDIIGIKGVITVPSPDALEYASVTLKRMEVGAKLIFSDPYRNGATSNVRFIEFDGNSSSFSGREPFIVIVGNVSFKMCEFVNCYYEGGKGGDVDTGTTGGAVYVGSGSATFSSCRFDDNCADYGAGIFNRGTVTLENCTLEGNWAEEIGGAIYNAGTLIIKNTELKGNTARIGGGLYNSGTTELYSSLVWNNTATIHGSDLANEGSLTDFTTDEEYNTLLNRYNLYYGGWADELDTSVGGIGEYKKFIATDTTPTPIDPEPIDPPVEPSEPTEPDEGDNTGENEGTTTPEDPDQGNTEEPTTPDGGEDNTDPPITPPDEGGDSTGADPVEPDTPSDTGKGDTTDNSSTDNSDHSTTDNSQSSTDNSTTDNSIVDNSQTSTSIDNSTSSSTVDNSSVVENIGAMFERVAPVVQDAFKGAFGNSGGLLDTFVGVVESALPVVENIIKSVSGVIKTVMPPVLNMIQSLGNVFTAVMPIVSNLVTVFGQVIEAVYPVIYNTISTALNAVIPIVNAFAGLIQSAMPIVQGIIQTFSNVVGMIFPVIQTVFQGLGEKIAQVVGVVTEHMGLVQGIFETVSPILQGAIEIVASVFSTAWDIISPIIDIAISVFDALLTCVEAVFPTIQGIVESVWSVLSGIFTAIADGLSLVGDAISGVASFIGDGIDTIGSWFGFAYGKDRVPYDNYPAVLHQGEKVLTRNQADQYERMVSTRGVHINDALQTVPRDTGGSGSATSVELSEKSSTTEAPVIQLTMENTFTGDINNMGDMDDVADVMAEKFVKRMQKLIPNMV